MSTAKIYKTKYFIKSFLITSILSLCLVLSANFLFAQENPRTITIVPPTLERNINPGDKAEGKLKVVNDSSTPITFKAIVRDFIVEDNIGTPKILAGDELSRKYSASSWIAVVPDSFTVAPGTSQSLSYYLQVPPDARPGGRYAAVVYEPQELIGVEGTGAGVQTHLGSLFLLRVNGDVLENSTVTKFQTPGFAEYGPVNLITEIKNLSDTHIKPKGVITIKNMFGQVMETQPLTEHNIFPEATRKFENTVGKKYMAGRYTAELQATYGTNNNLTLYAITNFIVFPWKIAGIILLIGIFTVLLLLYVKKRRIEKNSTASPDHTAQ